MNLYENDKKLSNLKRQTSELRVCLDIVGSLSNDEGDRNDNTLKQ